MNINTFSGHGTGDGRQLGPGTRLGNYVLRVPLGAGAMGQVWRAHDEPGERDVAVKMLPPQLRGNSEAIAQVRKSFQQVHKLTHQHIGKTLGMYEDPVHGPYIVMDLIPGVTLSSLAEERREQHGPLTVKNVVKLLMPVAEALDYAHSKGVLHRDVKPQNVLVQLQPETNITLIDFGLAATIRSTVARFTQGSIDSRGTRPYMSPEQIQGLRQEWDGRTDLYSLAAMAYELLSGFLPFEPDDDFAMMYAIINQPPVPIKAHPETVNQVLLKGLSKKREERYPNCVNFISALKSAESSPPVAARPPSETALESLLNEEDEEHDEQDWQAACQINTAESYDRYLQTWPTARHGEEADAKIRELRSHREVAPGTVSSPVANPPIQKNLPPSAQADVFDAQEAASLEGMLNRLNQSHRAGFPAGGSWKAYLVDLWAICFLTSFCFSLAWLSVGEPEAGFALFVVTCGLSALCWGAWFIWNAFRKPHRQSSPEQLIQQIGASHPQALRGWGGVEMLKDPNTVEAILNSWPDSYATALRASESDTVAGQNQQPLLRGLLGSLLKSKRESTSSQPRVATEEKIKRGILAIVTIGYLFLGMVLISHSGKDDFSAGIALFIATFVLHGYYWGMYFRNRRKRSQTRQTRQQELIQKIGDSFPKAIRAWGGRKALEDIDSLQLIVNDWPDSYTQALRSSGSTATPASKRVAFND